MRPTELPEWASTLEYDPVTGRENKLPPTPEFKLVGQKRGLPTPRQFLNYELDLHSKWISYLASQSLSSTVANDLDTTPDVSAVETLVVSNTAATSITNFDTTLDTQEIKVIATNGNTTIVNNANIILSGSTNLVMSANDVLILRKDANVGAAWIEVGRSIK